MAVCHFPPLLLFPLLSFLGFAASSLFALTVPAHELVPSIKCLSWLVLWTSGFLGWKVRASREDLEVAFKQRTSLIGLFRMRKKARALQRWVCLWKQQISAISRGDSCMTGWDCFFLVLTGCFYLPLEYTKPRSAAIFLCSPTCSWHLQHPHPELSVWGRTELISEWHSPRGASSWEQGQAAGRWWPPEPAWVPLAAGSAGPGLLWDVAGALLISANQVWLLWTGTDRCELSMLAGSGVAAISWPCAPAWKLGEVLKDSLTKVEPTVLSQPCSWPLDLCDGCFIFTLLAWYCFSLSPQGSKKMLKYYKGFKTACRNWMLRQVRGRVNQMYFLGDFSTQIVVDEKGWHQYKFIQEKAAECSACNASSEICLNKQEGKEGKKAHGKILTFLLEQAVCNKQQLLSFMAWKM